MSSPLLSIIIVSYNTRALTLQTASSCLNSRTDQSQLREAGNLEIIFIDNNSSDGSVEAIRNWQENNPKVSSVLIENSTNIGFGAANNQGLQVATGEFALLLNSDTIVQTGSLERLLEAGIRHPQMLLAARLQNLDGSYQAQGGDLPKLLPLFNHLFFVDDLPVIGRHLPSTQHTGWGSKAPRKSIHYKGWVAGTALLSSRQLWDALRGFDSKIFLYGEDVELCLRAALKGCAAAIVKEAPIVHLQSASSTSARAIIGEMLGYNYIARKHYTTWYYYLVKILLIKASVLRAGIFGMLGQKSKYQAYKAATLQLLTS